MRKPTTRELLERVLLALEVSPRDFSGLAAEIREYLKDSEQ